jgi:hypothetical protein
MNMIQVKMGFSAHVDSYTKEIEIDPVAVYGDFAVIPLLHGGRVDWFNTYSITHVPSGLCIWPDVENHRPRQNHSSKKFVTGLAEKLHESGLADMIGKKDGKWCAFAGARGKLNEVLEEMGG